MAALAAPVRENRALMALRTERPRRERLNEPAGTASSAGSWPARNVPVAAVTPVRTGRHEKEKKSWYLRTGLLALLLALLAVAIIAAAFLTASGTPAAHHALVRPVIIKLVPVPLNPAALLREYAAGYRNGYQNGRHAAHLAHLAHCASKQG